MVEFDAVSCVALFSVKFTFSACERPDRGRRPGEVVSVLSVSVSVSAVTEAEGLIVWVICRLDEAAVTVVVKVEPWGISV